MTDVPKCLEAARAEVRLSTTDPELGRVDRRVTKSLVLIGSANHCDIVLASDRIDPVHAAVVLLGNTAYLCDLGAPGGTSLNGRRIRWARLADGDELAIGRFKLSIDLFENTESISGEQPEFQLTDEDCIGTVKSIDPVLIVGSDPACDVVLFDDRIESRHGIVIWTQDGPIVRSLHGRKDIRLNGRVITGAALTEGDVIGVGPYELEFSIELCPESMQTHETPGRVMQQASLPASHVLLTSDPKIDPLDIVSGRLMKNSLSEIEHLWPPSAEDEAEDGFDEPAQMPVAETKSPSRNSESALKNQSQELCARVAAAQEALDARAQRHWKRLKEERERLAAYQHRLQQKAAELVEAARANIKLRREQAAAIQTEASATQLEKMTGDADPSEASQPVISADETNESLQARAARLAAMIKEEREIIDSAESRFDALRLEIERLRTFVAQTESKFARQSEELERRGETLKESESEIRSEREGLIARIRELDARFASVRTRLEEVGRNRVELDREAERLAESREKLARREDELRISREREAQRVQKRQAELRKKAAELAKAARDKRTLIEAEIAQRQAILDQREAELRAHRAALAEAGRAEMERTAADLERVLSARQPENETPQKDASTSTRTTAEVAQAAEQETPASAQAAGTGEQHRKLAAHIAQVEESLARAGQLDALREEVIALRSSLRQMGDDQAIKVDETANEAANAEDRIDRVSGSAGKGMRSDFAEKEALLRVNAAQTDEE